MNKDREEGFIMRELVIGLDIGTTSVKAVVFARDGKVVHEAEQLINTFYPKESYVEQNPKEIEEKSRLVLQTVLQQTSSENVLAVGISCAMHSIICVNKNGEPLSPMLIWSDGRSNDLIEQLTDEEKQQMYGRTGTPIHPMAPIWKLKWMKENQYVPYSQAHYYLSMKDYLLFQWTGELVTDYSMASASGLMNIHKLSWDKDALEVAGIKEEQLPRIVPPTYILSKLNNQMKQELQWPIDTKLVIGAADGQLANLGNGAIEAGEVAVSVGTSGAIRQMISGQHVNENGETFSYAFTNQSSIIGGPTNNGGIALQWLMDMMEFEGTHEEFIVGAEKVAIGSEGLLFIPYINGERAPVWNQKARGNFFGLSITHKREHLVRAVLEGIVFNLFKIGKSLEEIAGKPKTISVNGGLSKSPLWVQIMADVFGQEIQLAETHHAAAWGAAWTALVAIEEEISFTTIKQHIPIEGRIEPNMEAHERYMEIFKKYNRLEQDISCYF